MSKNQLKEHIEKIMSKSNYVLETPSYKTIMDDDYDSFDQPLDALGIGGPNPLDNNSGMIREIDPIPGDESAEDPMDTMTDPAMDGADMDMGGEMSPDQEMGGEMPPVEEPAPPVEDTPSPAHIQNQIIKKNIDVMKQLNDKIGSLESGINDLAMQNQELNMQNQEMHKEVEEVREPTNVEKLMTKKEDSHPYYYGLNDMWEGSWFQARRDETGEKGMKQLEDGSYVADFDEIQQISDDEVNKSFDNY